MANHRKTIAIVDSDLWYLVGLIASDGCLSNDARHVSITAKDFQFIEKIQKRLGLDIKIGIKNRARKNEAYHLQISNKNFYEFLLKIGLMPNKSLVLAEIKVPDERFFDFLRGVIDGDGNIRKWTHSLNKNEQWSLRIYSCSEKFAEWLYQEIEKTFCIKGCIHRQKSSGTRSDMFILKYGKLAAKAILNKCYYENALSLDRKASLAQECCLSSSGWKRAREVFLN